MNESPRSNGHDHSCTDRPRLRGNHSFIHSFIHESTGRAVVSRTAVGQTCIIIIISMIMMVMACPCILRSPGIISLGPRFGGTFRVGNRNFGLFSLPSHPIPSHGVREYILGTEEKLRVRRGVPAWAALHA
jgi:hypothetical protein